MTDDAPRGQWMTVQQAAEYLGVSTVTVRAWFDAGRLNGWRTGGTAGARRIWKDDAARRARREQAGRRRGAHSG